VACATRSLPALVQTRRYTRRRAPHLEGKPTSFGGCARVLPGLLALLSQKLFCWRRGASDNSCNSDTSLVHLETWKNY
jgi:hypothetical protein